MAQPTMPPPGGRTSSLDQMWAWFAALPIWERAIAWFVLWPALAAAKLFGATTRTKEFRYGTSAAMLLIGGFVWSQALTGGFSDDPAIIAVEPAAETDEEAEPDVVSPLDDAATAEVELAAIADEVCSEATTADGTLAGRTALRDGAADAARFTGFALREIRQAATVACGDQVEGLGAPAATGPDPDAVATDDERDAQVEPEGAGWTVFNVVDGDTVDVRAQDGGEERVRILGIDTPERGECGFGPASSKMAELVDGREVVLMGGARDDRDRYNRVLRYVEVDGTDVGFELIKTGLAIARYDSRDGYGPHPREGDYIAAQTAATAVSCPVPSPSPTATATATPSPTAAPTAAPSPTPVPAPPPPSASGPGSGAGGAWKNCTEARDAGAAPVYRDDPGYGKHLDRDGDGIGCE